MEMPFSDCLWTACFICTQTFAVWLTNNNLEASVSRLGHQGFSGRKRSLQPQACTLSHHNASAIITGAKSGDSLETRKCFHKYLPIIRTVANNASPWTNANHTAIFYERQLGVLSFILTAWPASPAISGLGRSGGKAEIFICWISKFG